MIPLSPDHLSPLGRDILCGFSLFASSIQFARFLPDFFFDFFFFFGKGGPREVELRWSNGDKEIN